MRTGRPRLTELQKQEQKELMLIKLEPYLKSGLSVNKALREAKVHNSEFYKNMADDFFREKIAVFRQYPSVLLNRIITNEIFRIARKQIGDVTNKLAPQTLTQHEVEFLCWFAIHANVCKEEWGRREAISAFNPDLELQRMKSTIEQDINKFQLLQLQKTYRVV